MNEEDNYDDAGSSLWEVNDHIAHLASELHWLDMSNLSPEDKERFTEYKRDLSALVSKYC